MPITQKRFIFEESYISNGKRQKSCTLIVILSHFIVSDVSEFLIRRQNRPDILSAGEEVVIKDIFQLTSINYSHMKLLMNQEDLGLSSKK